MCRRDAERVEEADRIAGHVVQRIRRVSRTTEQRHDVGRPERVELGGEADIAVVEPRHPESATCDQLAEGVIPFDHLVREPHHKEERRGLGIAEAVVLELEAVDARAGHVQMLAGSQRDGDGPEAPSR